MNVKYNICSVFLVGSMILQGCMERDNKYYALLEARKMEALVGNWISVQNGGYLHQDWRQHAEMDFIADYFMLDKNNDTLFFDKIKIHFNGSNFELQVNPKGNKQPITVYKLIYSTYDHFIFEMNNKNQNDMVAYSFTVNGGMIVKTDNLNKSKLVQNEIAFVKEEQR